MKKIISFSLWGDNPKYTIGAIRNAELTPIIFPNWVSRFYCGKSVPEDIIEKLKSLPHTEVIIMDEDGDWTGMFWRFYACEDSDIMLSRDTDSRLSNREKLAVDEWLESDKDFHIMRDHPHHNFPVMAGMWAFRNDLATWDIEKFLVPWLESHKIVDKIDDTNFLTLMYKDFVNSTLVHDDWLRCQNSVKFPTDRAGKRFIGEIFDENDAPDIHWTLL